MIKNHLPLARVSVAFLIFCLFISPEAKSQGSIVPLSPAGNFCFDDLWNMTLSVTNPSRYRYFYVTLTMSEAKRGIVVTARTGNFSLNTQTTVISRNNNSMIKPVTVNYSNLGTHSSRVAAGGTFPAGVYTYNYKFYGYIDIAEGQKKLELLAEYNNEIESQPVTCTELIYPYDKDTIREKNPTFTWSAPYPLTGSQQVSYHFRLVEILQEQTAVSALGSNSPLYTQNGISVTFLYYPPSAPALVPGHNYAWQVTALDGTTELCKSEAWEFTYMGQEKKEKKNPHAGSYVALRKIMDGNYFSVLDDTLKFTYRAASLKKGDSLLNFSISNLKNQVMASSENGYRLPLQRGTNFYEIDTGTRGIHLSKGFYILEVTDANGVKWFLKFYVTKEKSLQRNNSKQ